MRIKDKINKKNGGITLTSVCITKFYSFIIDGTLNKPSFTLKLYIKSLSLVLKRFLLENDLKTAIIKSTKYVSDKYKTSFKEMPIISIGICNNNNGLLEVAVINDIKCYLKSNNLITLTGKQANNHSILDINNFIYYTIPYDEPFSILFCNKVFQNYQEFLKLDDESFNCLIKEQGFRYCFGHIKRIQESNNDKNKEIINSPAAGLYKILV